MGYSDDPRHVRGDLFTDTGKWKYTVVLDYGFPGFQWDHWDMWRQTRQALAHATAKGISGVTLRQIPEGWSLVVLEPYSKFEHPITVTAEDNPPSRKEQQVMTMAVDPGTDPDPWMAEGI
jgi:hypothetical protein